MVVVRVEVTDCSGSLVVVVPAAVVLALVVGGVGVPVGSSSSQSLVDEGVAVADGLVLAGVVVVSVDEALVEASVEASVEEAVVVAVVEGEVVVLVEDGEEVLLGVVVVD